MGSSLSESVNYCTVQAYRAFYVASNLPNAGELNGFLPHMLAIADPLVSLIISHRRLDRQW